MDIAPMDKALKYAREGYAVFPLNGKLPAISKENGGNGVHDATTDESAIRDMWNRYPSANIGLAAGERSGFWVLDIDTAKGGKASLEALIAEHGPLPKTVMQETGSGGYHLLFKWPDGMDIRNRANNVGRGLDTRSTGGYIVVSPSLHPETGNPYRWAAGRALGEAEILPAPEWLLNLASPPVEASTAYSTPMTAPTGDYARAALVNECEAIKSAGNGDQEATLNSASFSIGQLVGSGALSRGEAESALISAGLSMPSYDAKRKWIHRDIEVKVKRGLDDGAREPRQVPERPVGTVVAVGIAAPHSESDDWPDPDMSVVDARNAAPPVFPVEMFRSWSPWIKAHSIAKSSAPDYIAGGLLSIAATAIGNARFAQAGPKWSEPTALNIGLVGKPSSGKSPGLDSALDILHAIERDMNMDYPDRLRLYETEKEVARLANEAWLDAVQTAVKEDVPAPEKPQDAVEPDKPGRRQIIVNDATVEELGYILAANPKGVLQARDELSGWLGNLDKYGKGDKSFYIESWGGRPFKVNRRNRSGEPLEIRRSTMSIVGGIQPDKLNELLFKVSDDGLSARFLMLWPSAMRPSVSPVVPNDAAAERAIRRLASLDLVCSADGEPTPDYIPLSNRGGEDDAAGLFNQWRANHFDLVESESGLLCSHLGKLPGITLRLALVFTFLEWANSPDESPPTEISQEAMSIALTFIDEYAIPMARRVYGNASVSETDRKAAALAQSIIREDEAVISKRSIYRDKGKWRCDIKDAKEADAVLSLLCDLDWLRPIDAGTGPDRRKAEYAVNPKVKG
jgi:putative DNA primase/helicase